MTNTVALAARRRKIWIARHLPALAICAFLPVWASALTYGLWRISHRPPDDGELCRRVDPLAVYLYLRPHKHMCLSGEGRLFFRPNE